MSATNWDECPRCFREQETAAERAAAAYGKVSEAEYRRLLATDPAPIDDEEQMTLREDYEVYWADGVFHVLYSGQCKRCGFFHEFRHEEALRAVPASTVPKPGEEGGR